MPKYKQLAKGETLSAPFISLNTHEATKGQLCLPYQALKVGNYNIGIIALTDSTKSKVKILKWRTTMQNQMAKLEKKFDFIILLSNLSTKDNKIIANSFPSIQVIIGSDPKIKNLSPSIVGKTIITQTGTLGQYLGVMDITLSPEIKWKANYFSINNLYVKQAINNKKIVKLEKQGNAPGEVSILRNELKGIPGKIKDLKKRLPKQKGSSFTMKFVPITSSVMEDAVIKQIVD
ncbi:MAG: hypothetical protein OCC45_12125 [Desulfotalea sp.]